LLENGATFPESGATFPESGASFPESGASFPESGIVLRRNNTPVAILKENRVMVYFSHASVCSLIIDIVSQN
jgi:hypothetical protein